LTGLTRALARSSLNEQLFLSGLVDTLREKYSHLTIPGAGAGLSDLLAGEFQTALDDLIKLLEAD
jgi:hypothetical protein